MWQVWGPEKVHTEHWWENLKEKYNLEELVADGRITVKRKFKKQDGKAWARFTSHAKDKWLALVNNLLNFRGNFLAS
jgi:hypothetical protein